MRKNEMTKREKINHIMNIAGVMSDPIAKEYLEHELELLENRKAGNGEKAKQKAEEKEMLRNNVVAVLKTGNKDGMTATEIQKMYDGDITSQKVVAILHGLIDEGIVERFTCKKVPYFTLKG